MDTRWETGQYTKWRTTPLATVLETAGYSTHSPKYWMEIRKSLLWGGCLVWSLQRYILKSFRTRAWIIIYTPGWSCLRVKARSCSGVPGILVCNFISFGNDEFYLSTDGLRKTCRGRTQSVGFKRICRWLCGKQNIGTLSIRLRTQCPWESARRKHNTTNSIFATQTGMFLDPREKYLLHGQHHFARSNDTCSLEHLQANWNLIKTRTRHSTHGLIVSPSWRFNPSFDHYLRCII